MSEGDVLVTQVTSIKHHVNNKSPQTTKDFEESPTENESEGNLAATNLNNSSILSIDEEMIELNNDLN